MCRLLCIAQGRRYSGAVSPLACSFCWILSAYRHLRLRPGACTPGYQRAQLARSTACPCISAVSAPASVCLIPGLPDGVQILEARPGAPGETLRLTCGGRELADSDRAGCIAGTVLCLLYDSSLAAHSSKCAPLEPAQQPDIDMLPPDWVRPRTLCT